MHEWHARESMQFVADIGRAVLHEHKEAACRVGRKTHGSRRNRSPIGRRKERRDIRESGGKERSRTVDKGALPSSASLNRT